MNSLSQFQLSIHDTIFKPKKSINLYLFYFYQKSSKNIQNSKCSFHQYPSPLVLLFDQMQMWYQYFLFLADCKLKQLGLSGDGVRKTGRCIFNINGFYQHFFTYLNFLMLASFGIMVLWFFYRLVQFNSKRFQKYILQGM